MGNGTLVDAVEALGELSLPPALRVAIIIVNVPEDDLEPGTDPGDDPMQESVMAWVYIFFAGLLEIGWALGLKASHGFTRPLPTVFTLSAAALSFWLLAQAMKALPAGTAYAVWSGIGAVGTVLLGIILFGEALSPVRLLCLAMIVGGIAGLKIFAG